MRIINVDGFDVFVDDEDWLWLVGFNWQLDPRNYVRSTRMVDGENYMHRLIARSMSLDLSNEIDHRDTNVRNNQRSNLRTANPSQNQANRDIPANNTTGHKGLELMKNGKYRSSIRVNGKLHHLGTFLMKDQAIEAYRQAALKHFGDFAKQ